MEQFVRREFQWDLVSIQERAKDYITALTCYQVTASCGLQKLQSLFSFRKFNL